MSRCLFGLFVAVVVIKSFVSGNPGGTPDAACDNMVPNHGTNAQMGSSGYTISLSSMNYTCGGSITG